MTKKPLSTISFNTLDFVKAKLDILYQTNIISMYIFIPHFAEEDTKKNHIHIYIQPNKPIDANKIRKEFLEIDLNNSKPLGCLPFSPSKLHDWILYALHDSSYLASKGLVRLNHYSLDNIVSSEPVYCIQQFINDAKETMQNNRVNVVLQMIKQGLSFGEILKTGIIPPSQIVFYDKLYKLNYHGQEHVTNDIFDTPF